MSKQKCFCTPDEAIDPIFPIKFQLSSMFIAGEIKEIPSVKFFLKHPVAIAIYG